MSERAEQIPTEQCLNKICVAWAIIWMCIIGLGDYALITFSSPLLNSTIPWPCVILTIIAWSLLAYFLWSITGMYIHNRWVEPEMREVSQN
jgi:hypothetical protein